jgi:DNA-binding CsgD family transcriptional regulator
MSSENARHPTDGELSPLSRSAGARGQPELVGRDGLCRELDRLGSAVGAGQSRALVLRGEPGIGKTTLLDYLAASATECRVERAAGVESEHELAFAGLHQLCTPMLDHLDNVAAPQRAALQIALGRCSGPAPDRFLVGLAVLSLLSDVAHEQPLLCLVDDAQWLDHASAQALAFVARRLGAESVGLVFTAGVPTRELAGLPELLVEGLPDQDARVLLDSALTGPIDERVRDQIIAETHGNPLGLLELPRGLTPAQLAGGFGIPGAIGRTSSVAESFRRRVDGLPGPTRRLLLIAAADPTGDAALVWRAATRLGIGSTAAVPAAEARLAEFAARVRFSHPLVRSAAYRSGSVRETQLAHRVLAEVTDARLDPDRRAWHLALAAAGPDAEAADELEQSADRARSRGGVAAAAAFLERSAMLTLAPEQRARRALAAADAMLQAGDLGAARDLLATAEAGPAGEAQQAHVDLLRGRIAFAASRGSEAPTLLLAAARRLESVDPAVARSTYLEALSAGIFAGQLASPGSGLWEVARAALTAPASPTSPRAPDLLLDGLAAYYIDGYAAGVPVLRKALTVFGTGMSVAEELRWLWLACLTAVHVWDDDAWERLSARYLTLVQQTGALGEQPLALSMRAQRLLLGGELTASEALVAEAQAATEATGGTLAPYGALSIAGLRGDERRVSTLVDAVAPEATGRGEGAAVTAVGMANALLFLGLGRYQEAMPAAQLATASPGTIGTPPWAIAELIEAAVRTGKTDVATDAYERFAEMTDASGTDWALGHQARARALLSEGTAADDSYREAIGRLQRTGMRICLARAHLLYGEWLRRERRRTDAREQLRAAFSMLDSMGVAAFAERARRELLATGETARKRAVGTPNDQLTAQETQIARLARDGLSNPQIGARLYLSAHTVQYHLRKVFAKLGITARSQLELVLPDKTEASHSSTSPASPASHRGIRPGPVRTEIR